MEDQRQLLWCHRWVIVKAFEGKVSQAEIESFIRHGMASPGAAPPMPPGYHEKVAEILKTGKVVFD